MQGVSERRAKCVNHKIQFQKRARSTSCEKKNKPKFHHFQFAERRRAFHSKPAQAQTLVRKELSRPPGSWLGVGQAEEVGVLKVGWNRRYLLAPFLLVALSSQQGCRAGAASQLLTQPAGKRLGRRGEAERSGTKTANGTKR